MYGRPNAPPPMFFFSCQLGTLYIINSKRLKVTHFEWILILLCVLSCGNIISYNSNYEGTSICLRVSFPGLTPDQTFEQKVFIEVYMTSCFQNTANKLTSKAFHLTFDCLTLNTDN